MDYGNLTSYFVQEYAKFLGYHVLMPVNLIAVSSSQGSNHEGIQPDALHWYLGSMNPKALTMGIFHLFYPSPHSTLYKGSIMRLSRMEMM